MTLNIIEINFHLSTDWKLFLDFLNINIFNIKFYICLVNNHKLRMCFFLFISTSCHWIVGKCIVWIIFTTFLYIKQDKLIFMRKMMNHNLKVWIQLNSLNICLGLIFFWSVMINSYDRNYIREFSFFFQIPGLNWRFRKNRIQHVILYYR